MTQIWTPDGPDGSRGRKILAPGMRGFDKSYTMPGARIRRRSGKQSAAIPLTYNQTIELDAAHFWDLGNPLGTTSITDNIGSFNSTSINSITFGDAGGCGDGSTCVYTSSSGNGIAIGAAQLLPIASDWTFEWAFNMDNAGYSQYFLSMYASGKASYVTISASGTSMRLDYTAGSSIWSMTLSTGIWYYCQITLVFATKAATLYINNVNEGSKTATGFTASVFVANSYICGAQSFIGYHGYMQKPAIYNSALSNTELTAHYNKWLTG